MPRVHFTESYTHVPHPMQAVEYKAGRTYLVSQMIAAVVVALRKGKIVPSPGEEGYAEPPRFNAKGADASAVVRIERGLDQLSRTLPPRLKDAGDGSA